VTDAIVIHLADDQDPDSSNLLFVNFAAVYWQNYGEPDWFDPALPVGTSFFDAASGVTIHPVWADGTSAGVSISFSPQTCTPQVPQVSVSPANQSATAGTAVNYTVEVINQDSAGCAQSTFALQRIIPGGWTGSLSSSTLALMPGETGSTIFSVTSATNATPGSYALGVNVTDAAEAIHVAVANASQTVVDSCVPAISGLTPSPASQSGGAGSALKYTITLVNNDSASCSASAFDLTISALPGGWSGKLSQTRITLSPGATGTATLTVTSPNTATASSYNVQVGISDMSETKHAKTAAVTYLVKVKGKGRQR
jgi:hypothetical protein